MRNLLLTAILVLSSMISYACHESYTTLVSAPTDIGGGQYQTTVQFCIGQTVNWGGTFDFTVNIIGANFVSYSPTSLSNTYNAYTTASCGGPNCFMGTCASITANANSTSTATTVTYTTSSSTPAGYPLVPDDVETCGANPVSYCFNFTFVSDAYPTSISLGGNTELTRTVICQSVCGHPATYTSPCNGAYEAAMTYTFTTPLPIELISFDGENVSNSNLLEWSTASEINNDYFLLEISEDGYNWEDLARVSGSGNSTQVISYRFSDMNYKNVVNYYRLSQVDFDGRSETFNIISIDNSSEPLEVIKMVNMMGQEVDEYQKGFVIYYYSDGTYKKIIK